jgi:hypothetical protein
MACFLLLMPPREENDRNAKKKVPVLIPASRKGGETKNGRQKG